MAKNVALSDKAYQTLAKMKGREESFSDVVLKLAEGKKAKLSDFAGIWKDDKEISEIYDKILKERHEQKARWVTI